MTPSPIPPLAFTLILLAILPGVAKTAELEFSGYLGNSGDEKKSRVSFQGEIAPGIGPVLDDEQTIWERGGSTRLNRYALDGRLLASFEIPQSTDKTDQLTNAGDRLVMKLGKSVYSLPRNAEPGTQATKLSTASVSVMSSNAVDGKVVVFEKDELFQLDVTTGELTSLSKPGHAVHSLFIGSSGEVYAFGGNEVHCWENGVERSGFPRGFTGDRQQKIGDFWYSHSWHGTINRMNAEFEPAPGVVLGGASGSFIGFLPQSADLSKGQGMVSLGNGIFAVSGTKGVVQFLQWDPTELNFKVVRRIGAMPEPGALAIDAAGNIWTPRGAWQWTDSPETPHTIGDMEGSTYAQPVVIDGKRLCVLKKHYTYVQLASGSIIDAQGWSHLDNKNIQDYELSESISGGTAVETSDGLSLVAAEKNGKAYRLGINREGQLRTVPEEIELPGLTDCTSLAWFGNQLIAAGKGRLSIYEPTDEKGNQWKLISALSKGDGDLSIHSDGKRLAVCDTKAGKLEVFEALNGMPTSRDGLAEPTHVAISGNRLVVYETGNQRVARFELVNSEKPRADLPTMETSAPPGELVTQHGDVDFETVGRPGGIPLSTAISATSKGLTLSVRTDPDPDLKTEVGIANREKAYHLTGDQAVSRLGGQFDFALPSGDWSNLRFAASVKSQTQRERFRFLDHQPIHAAFNEDPTQWAEWDMETYREAVEGRKQQIRITFEQPLDGKASLVIEDSAGHRVRNLVSGREFTEGVHTVVWDGLDEFGKLVAPGRYRWRGIAHPGLKPVYRMNFGNGGEDTVASWGPNHSTFMDATSNGKLVFLAAPVTEGGWALVALDAAGNFVQGYEHQHGFGIQRDAIAADDHYLYCAQDGFAWGGHKGIDQKSDQWTADWTITVVRYEIESGKLVEFPGKKRALEIDTLQVGPGSSHPNLEDFNLSGLAVANGKLYVGCRSKNEVRVVDAQSGNFIESIKVQGPRHLAVHQNAIYAATDDQGVIRLTDGKSVIPGGNMDLTGIAMTSTGEFLVSDGRSHQILRFSPKGIPEAVIGTPGGPYKGSYDPARMVNPAGLTLGPEGKLWVTENRWNPKRILAWDMAKNEVVFEKFGMPHYGGDGSGFDPENPSRWIGLGCFWEVDLEKKSARPTHILSIKEGHFGNYEPHSYLFFRENGRTFVSARGKIPMISEVLADGTLHDLVATADTAHFAYGCDWDPPQAYRDAFYEKWPEKKTEAEVGGTKGEGKPWAQRGMAVLWVDRNGDGEAQKEEFEFCGDKLKYGGGAWGHMQTSLTLLMPIEIDGKVSIVSLTPKGALANGVPDYPTLEEAINQSTPVDLSPGYKRSDVPTIRDHRNRFLFNSDPEMNAFDLNTGEHLWTFPNQWSNVHGSHDAPLPEPGVMQGTLGILGLATFDDQGDLFFMNGNHGRCFVLTTDGIYLDEAFTDVRVSYLKNEYRLGGEIFGGSFGRSEKDGKYFVQIGHGPYRIYELTGLDRAKRVSGEVDVSKEQIAAAERENLRKTAETHVVREVSVPGTISWDKSGKFNVKLDLKIDETHLHLHFQVSDSSPWVNAGRDWTKLFATGDSVDFQIAVNPDANPKRRDPVVGDKRLSIAPFENGNVAVLYDYIKPDGERNSIEFTSPWRGAKVDHVSRINDALIEVKTGSNTYTVTAAIPLKALGWPIDPTAEYQADFGVTFGDSEGTDTNLRSYWSNQSTGLVDDIPGEIMLQPNLWGKIRIQSK